MTDYTSWHVGMKVVCVDDDGAAFLFKGEVYAISAIRAGSFFDVYGAPVNGVGVHVAGVDIGNSWYNARRFRPVEKRKTDISIFTKLLNTKSEKELVQ